MSFPESESLKVGFVETNMSAKDEDVVRFYNGHGTAEQWIGEKIACKVRKEYF